MNNPEEFVLRCEASQNGTFLWDRHADGDNHRAAYCTQCSQIWKEDPVATGQDPNNPKAAWQWCIEHYSTEHSELWALLVMMSPGGPSTEERP